MQAPTPTCVCNWSRTGIWKSSVGLNDTETRLRKLVGVSAAFGCASLVPRPAEVLTPRHNFERPLPKGVWWDRYILVGAPSAGAGWEHVWEAVPPGVRVAEVRAWAEDRLPANATAHQKCQRAGHRCKVAGECGARVSLCGCASRPCSLVQLLAGDVRSQVRISDVVTPSMKHPHDMSLERHHVHQGCVPGQKRGWRTVRARAIPSIIGM